MRVAQASPLRDDSHTVTVSQPELRSQRNIGDDFQNMTSATSPAKNENIQPVQLNGKDPKLCVMLTPQASSRIKQDGIIKQKVQSADLKGSGGGGDFAARPPSRSKSVRADFPLPPVTTAVRDNTDPSLRTIVYSPQTSHPTIAVGFSLSFEGNWAPGK